MIETDPPANIDLTEKERRKNMEAILMREQAGKLFPVYTHHAAELEQLRDIADGILSRHTQNPEDEKTQAIRRLRGRLEQVAGVLRDTFGDVAYVSGRDLDLVRKAAEWLREHPKAPGA